LVAFYVVFIVLPKCSQKFGWFGYTWWSTADCFGSVVADVLRIAGVLLQVDILSIVGCPSSFRLLSGGGLLIVV